jgi:steroid delta-isomerase-like uncharacterized protein
LRVLLAALLLTCLPVAGIAQDCPPTDRAGSEAIARRWHEDAINARTPAALREILGASVTHHAAGGYPDTMQPAEVEAMMAGFLTSFPDLEITIDDVIVENDKVVERYTASGTQTGPFGDLPASGRAATWTGINIFRIECGRIVEIWSEVDALARNRQLIGDMP